jgi:hypothetical protein
MAVLVLKSTIIGGYTPHCNKCGIALCWDISEIDYQESKIFWDNWLCKDCNPDYKGSLKRFAQNRLKIK